MPRRSLSKPSIYHLKGYSVRESRRAKRASIHVDETATVEIVVPCGYPKQQVLDFLRTQQGWIDRTVSKIRQKRRSRPPETKLERPDTIQLRSIPQEWQVEYQAIPNQGIRLVSPKPLQLVISGNIDSVSGCHNVLQQWVRHQAKGYLPQWLTIVSQEIGLPFQKATVRRQKTLWASCSNQANISLNDKLMFLPFPLVRYIFVHELCHTIHMNHSADFWVLVGQKDPDYRRADAAMKDAGQYVPDWLTTG